MILPLVYLIPVLFFKSPNAEPDIRHPQRTSAHAEPDIRHLQRTSARAKIEKG